MRFQARFVFLLAAAAFLAALAYVWLKPAQQGATAAATSAAPPATAAAAVPPPAEPPAAAAAAAAAPEQAASFAERRAVLDQRAAAGDAAAAAELGGILANCWRYVPATQEKIEEAVVNGLAGNVEAPLVAGVPAPPELLLLMLQQSQQELARRCTNLGPRWKWREMAQVPALLERAADAGQVQAMLDYAQHAFIDYGAAAEMLQDADEVKRRKEKARAFLRQALRRGEARALLLQADAYAAGPLENIDPFAAYAYMSAFFASAAAQDWPPRLRELYLQTVAQRLDPAQIAQARERGLQIYQDFQNGVAAP
ncbi:hypothetical protein [Tahibacter harae]|uniref:Sel1 repeat family protein n=1 Tax=Tahibacter harae TaxID=2963937 RepID=A0ABT1QNW5_9GAMM|nr:hypothetical protein [Tahibacter harae]MCQ4163395.1 hypothetical protein [Tahibacter harae]